MTHAERIPRKRLCRWCRTNQIRHCAAREDIETSQLFSLLAADMAMLDNPRAVPEALELEKLEAAWPEVKEIIAQARTRKCRWIK